MRKEFKLIILTILLVVVYKNQVSIISFVEQKVFDYTHGEIIVGNTSIYNKAQSFKFVNDADTYAPSNYDELLAVYYTILDNGWPEFKFYCDIDYDCVDDLLKIAEDPSLLSNINNFVHPFNSYKTIQSKNDSFHNITVSIEKTYNGQQIASLDKKVNEIYAKVVKDSMSDRTKIKAVHDYIINTSTYDRERVDYDSTDINTKYTYNSNLAIGPLFEGQAICRGYSDAMALFLEKMNLPNIKVAGNNHVWNLVYIEGQWLHVDLTWDDPLTSDGSNILEHSYFLVTTKQLEALEFENKANALKNGTTYSNSHLYDKSIYIEAN